MLEERWAWGSVAGLLPLQVVSGPLCEVSVGGSVCAAASGRSSCLPGRSLSKDTCLTGTGQAECFMSFDLVLDILSRHFCYSHRFAQVQGEENLDRPHLLKASGSVGDAAKIT